MARSRRRTSPRTTSQRAASLIAFALPGPIQRVADTRFGSLLMLVGVPLLAVFGLLNITWVDGFPTFSFNRNRAAELKQAAREHLNELERQAATNNWGNAAVELLHSAQGPDHSHQPLPFTPSGYPTSAQSYNWPQQQPQQQQQQFQLPQYQQPMPYQAPQYQTPQYQAPQYQSPQYQSQQYPSPQYQQSNFQSPAAYSQQPSYQPQAGYPQQPGYQQWPAQSNQQTNQMNRPAAYSQNGGYAQPNTYGQSNVYNPQSAPASYQSNGYPIAVPANSGHSLPSTSAGQKSSYSNPSGPLGRF